MGDVRILHVYLRKTRRISNGRMLSHPERRFWQNSTNFQGATPALKTATTAPGSPRAGRVGQRQTLHWNVSGAIRMEQRLQQRLRRLRPILSLSPGIWVAFRSVHRYTREM